MQTHGHPDRVWLAVTAGLTIAFAPIRLAAVTVTGEVIDDKTGRVIPGRIYIRSDSGKWFFPQSASPEGSAVRYQRQNWINTNTVEQHTTLSAHPFRVELEPGVYTFTVERGKEYRVLTRRVEVGTQQVKLSLSLHRWVNLAAKGWFSGDTHVHRDPAELPNVMLAEDVNVVLPMVFWTTAVDVPPSQSGRNVKGYFPAAVVTVDATHLYYPRNTEYEIFTTAKGSHTLGAILAINHQSVFDLPALPVSRVAERARAEGALLDLEKHNWPWSMALVPLVRPDLYELANNHHWRTTFSITNWAVPAPDWMAVGSGSGTEREWTLYGFQNYYALLDCGFRLRPAAGTANGVHPIPLGFGRVYVHLNGGFSYAEWLKALNEGRSFVTTGPMLFSKVNGELPGYHFKMKDVKPRRIEVEGVSVSEQPVTAIEIIVDGQVAHRLAPAGRKNRDDAFETKFRQSVELTGSSWVAVRCWEEREGGRMRFAHSAPTFFDLPGVPLRPRKEEIGFLVQRVREEIERSASVLSPEALAEYRKALAAYEEIARTAR